MVTCGCSGWHVAGVLWTLTTDSSPGSVQQCTHVTRSSGLAQG